MRFPLNPSNLSPFLLSSHGKAQDFIFMNSEQTLAFLEDSLQETLGQILKSKSQLTPNLSEVLSQTLFDSMSYSLFTPGKRLRPRLLLACSNILQLPMPSLLPAALALEMLHCFTLIHDDLPCMDNDDFRRGLPSNHKKFGESIALLAGDALLSTAIEVFLGTKDIPLQRLQKGLKRFLRSIGPHGVIGGQAAELTLAEFPSLEHLIEVYQKKTGALFETALLIPLDFKGMNPLKPQSIRLQNFANALGFSFQVADDLEDDPKIPAPSNILYYLTVAQAKAKALLVLTPTLSLLKKDWGKASTGLIQLAEEVIEKIELTAKRFT